MADHSTTKAMLEAKLKELLERASGIEDVLSDPGDRDWEENAVAMEEDEALAAVGDVTKQEISDIKLALHRIETGKYGLCVSCGGPISRERLMNLPWTSNCVHCA